MARVPGLTDRDIRIRRLEEQVRSLEQALAIACGALDADEQLDDVDPTPESKAG